MDNSLFSDHHYFVLINSLSDHPVTQQVAWFFSLIGEGWILAILGCLGMWLFDRRRFPKNFLVLAAAILLASGVTQIIKSAVDRPRPMGDHALIGQELNVVRHDVLEPLGIERRTVKLPENSPYLDMTRDGNGQVYIVGRKLTRRSFPSGHSTAALAFAVCMIYGSRSRWRYLWFLPAIYIPFSRVVVGAHFPIDIHVGSLIGIVVTYGALRATEIYHGLGARKKKRKMPAGPDPVIAFVAGEASADTYGANLIGKLKEADPKVRVFGIGGRNMKQAGLELVHDTKDISIVGLTGVLTAIHRILSVYNDMLRQIKKRKPHVLVCIDLPDFNLMLANQAQSMGTRVVYYISPQVWAWRTGRVHTIAKRVDRMIVAFPFEKKLYEKTEARVDFFGHPILETIRPSFENKEQAFAYFGLDPAKKVFVIAPGSRKNEIKYITESIFEAGRIMAEALPNWQFAVPVAPNVDQGELEQIAKKTGFFPVYATERFHDLLNIASFGIITSGTATLEAALFGCPMLIVYKGHGLNAAVARKLVKIENIGLPNIIAGETLFPEILQEEASGEELARRSLEIVNDPQRLETFRGYCDRVRRALAGGDTSRQVAKTVLEIAKSEMDTTDGEKA